MTFVLALLWLAAGDPTPQVSDDFLIQLGAEHSEAEAAHSWIVIKNKAGAVLDGLEPKITPVTVPRKGRLWRLRAGPVDAAGAASVCARLKPLGIDCMVVR
jgi:cell division septation protein DedD